MEFHTGAKGVRKMEVMKVSLESIEKVKKFVSHVTQFDVDMDLASDRYVVDAKSILGIFSMDLSKPLKLQIHTEREDVEKIFESLKEYTVE